MPEQKTSDEFWRATVQGGCAVCECEWCGTTYVANGDCLEDGELEEYKNLAAAKPGNYVIEECHSITKGTLNGKELVTHCEKCDAKVAQFEAFIWAHRNLIGNYLRARREKEFKEAEAEVERQKRDLADA